MKTPTFQTEAQKTFCQTFQKLCSHTSAWQAWSDFIQLAAISLSNCCDMQAKREKQHNEIMQQYDRAERSIFAELFEQTVMALEEQSEQDFLGDMFMQLNLGSHWHGQFFTPYSVCRLMSSITIQSAVEQVSEHGYCKVNDSACGAGATLIAARNSLQSAGIGTDQALFVGQDIDRTAALMCYIQLSLLGCAGYVVIADTLSNPAVGGGGIIPRRKEGQDIWFMPGLYLSDAWCERIRWETMMCNS